MNAKKVALVAVVLFLGFWMFTDPSGLADAGETGAVRAWELTTRLFQAVIEFVGALG